MKKEKDAEQEDQVLLQDDQSPVAEGRAEQPEAIVYGDSPAHMRCPHCLELIHSEIILKPQFISVALGMCFFALVPNLIMMLLIVTIVQLTASRKHRCPLCERQLGSDGKFLLYFVDQVYSWSFLSGGVIFTKKNIMTAGMVAFAMIALGYRSYYQKQSKFVATTWPQYMKQCSELQPNYCLQKYKGRQFKNWQGHLLKLEDNQEHPTKWYLHAISMYLKMEPSLHPDRPDLLVTLDTDVVFFNKDLVRNLIHGDKLKFNCTLHERERGSLKDVMHFHVQDIQMVGHDKNYALYTTPIQQEWIQIHVQDRGQLTSQPQNSSKIKPI